jgi:vacuolar-type H+-ATPase subunit C/Vma6
VLDVFAADQDRRNLRALLRGAVQGAPSEARLAALVPTPLLPQRALGELARHPSAADVARQLVRLPYPDASRLLPIVAKRHPDLLALDRALLLAFAERTTRVAARADDTLREFVRTVIDAGNVQNALLIAGAPRDLDPEDNFVAGGRWLSAIAFMSAANAGSPERALTRLAAALARSPLGAMLPVVATDIAHMDRAFLVAVLQRLARAARLEPLGTAPVLRVLLLIAAQSRDLRTLTWGAALGSPASRRRQQLVTPS